MLSFIAWHGEIPAGATRIEGYRAREHAASWIRQHIGVGIVHSYVIGYEAGDCWWTLFFERTDRLAPDDAEVWHVEAYNYAGKSWSGRYYHWLRTNRWRHVFFVQAGDNYGRHPQPV